MKIRIYEKDIKLTLKEEEYVQTKMEKLMTMAKRIKDESTELRVDIRKKETKDKDDSITCVITLYVPKDTLRVSENGSKINEAVDKAQETMFPQIEKYKAKFIRK
jgi:ribosomal subunit interface protein